MPQGRQAGDRKGAGRESLQLAVRCSCSARRRRRRTLRSCRATRSTRWPTSSPSSCCSSCRSVVIVLFWMVHVLPEKIAQKRHHPQNEAHHHAVPAVAGLRRPAVAARLAVGVHQADRLPRRVRHRQARRLLRARWPRSSARASLLREEARHLREELESMEARGALPPKLRALKDELARCARPRPTSARGDRGEGRQGGARWKPSSSASIRSSSG